MSNFEFIGKLLAIQEKHLDFFRKNDLTILEFIDLGFNNTKLKLINIPMELKDDIKVLKHFNKKAANP